MFINDINDDIKWENFLQIKLNNNFVTTKEKKYLEKYILQRKYEFTVGQILNDNYSFSIPKKCIISKNRSLKKRIVYSFNNDEMIFLKYVAYLLYDYDYLFQNNLYSFRKKISVKTAINNITNIHNIKNMFGYKVDIKNYFNSINVDILLSNLKNDLDCDMFKFIKKILSEKKTIYNGNEILEEKGAMAGIPISSFLANYYIKEIDEFFKKEKLFYMRYSDDIIIFCNLKDEIIKYANILKRLLVKYNLNINTEKECFFYPNEKWDFLGYSFDNGVIDLSNNSLNKIKGKIRRSSRSIRRWMKKKNVPIDLAVKTMIKKYNKKFYGAEKTELSWKYWFFPVINTDKNLKIIDNYLQDNLRYIFTGKHNKRNYRKIPYSKLKAMGYKSLVHEYYLFRNTKKNV